MVNQKSSFRCCWLTPQAFHWGAFRKKEPYSKYRYPTEQEMRSMVLLAMNLGTKGYLFYSHTPIFNEQEKRDPGSSKIFWPQVCNVAKLLRELEPFFFTKEVAPKVIVKNESIKNIPLVEAKAYKANGKTIVVVTSDGPGHANAILTISGSRSFKSRYGFTRSLGNDKYRFEGDNICSDVLESIE